MSSKGQGLSLNTIIIAAIVLVVLLILVGMTTGYFGNKWKPAFGRLTETSCRGQDGEEKTACATTEKEVYAAETSEGKKCCAKKSCEELGGNCCGPGSGGYRKIENNYWSCKGNKQQGENCCLPA